MDPRCRRRTAHHPASRTALTQSWYTLEKALPASIPEAASPSLSPHFALSAGAGFRFFDSFLGATSTRAGTPAVAAELSEQEKRHDCHPHHDRPRRTDRAGTDAPVRRRAAGLPIDLACPIDLCESAVEVNDAFHAAALVERPPTSSPGGSSSRIPKSTTPPSR